MPTIRAIATDSLRELGVLAATEAMDASQGALALLRAQNMFDSWAAMRLTLSRQLRTQFTLTSGSSTATLGPGGTAVMVRPMFLNSASYIVPGSSPPVEAPEGLALLDQDQYAALTIKTLSNALPTAVFYQVNLDGILGTLTFWPVVAQNVDIVIYTPEAVPIPLSLNTVLTGPSGYAEAFMYQLALRLVTPFGVRVEEQCPMLPEMAARAWDVLTKPNVRPGLLGMDPAVTQPTQRGGYNVYTDS
jgi:hypothetical protein